MKKRNRVLSYIKARGFYIALALCITGASVAAWVSAAEKTGTVPAGESSQITEAGASSEEEEVWNAEPIVRSEPESAAASQSTAREESSSRQSTSSSASASRQSSSSASAASSAPSETPGGQSAQQICAYTSPIKGGKIIGEYGNGKLVKNYTLGVWRIHDAIDIAPTEDPNVAAVCDGVVLSAVNDPLWGGVVKIEHPDGCMSVYCGVNYTEGIKEGERVVGGQVIGTVGSIASEVAMEAHIHFAITKDGEALDPTTMFSIQ